MLSPLKSRGHFLRSSGGIRWLRCDPTTTTIWLLRVDCRCNVFRTSVSQERVMKAAIVGVNATTLPKCQSHYHRERALNIILAVEKRIRNIPELLGTDFVLCNPS